MLLTPPPPQPAGVREAVTAAFAGGTSPLGAPLPFGEDGRINALNAYDILDTLPEQSFDDLTQLAAEILNCPIALVSLVGSDRLWFKSFYGMPPGATQVATHANTVLQVKNVTHDRFLARNGPSARGPF